MPAADGKLRLLAQHRRRDLSRRRDRTRSPTASLGYEWDDDVDNGFQPAGSDRRLVDDARRPQQSVIRTTADDRRRRRPRTTSPMYRAPSGALVFGAGTVQWSWGLDGNHDRGDPADPTAHAAGDRQPVRRHGRAAGTLQAGLVAGDGVDRHDRRRPRRSPRRPQAHGRRRRHDRHGHRHGRRRRRRVVGGVEVSTDGGTTWHPATGRDAAGPTRGRRRRRPASRSRPAPSTTAATSSRPPPAVTSRVNCPCSLFSTRDPRRAGRERRHAASRSACVPRRRQRLRHRRPVLQGHRQHRHARRQPVDHDGDAARDGDVHERDGDGLAAGHLLDRRSRSPPNTDYVASYHTNAGHYAVDPTRTSSRAPTPRRSTRPRSSARDGNGVYAYGTASTFPTSTTAPRTTGSTSSSRPTRPRRPSSRPTSRRGATGVAPSTTVTATFSEPVAGLGGLVRPRATRQRDRPGDGQ